MCVMAMTTWNSSMEQFHVVVAFTTMVGKDALGCAQSCPLCFVKDLQQGVQAELVKPHLNSCSQSRFCQAVLGGEVEKKLECFMYIRMLLDTRQVSMLSQRLSSSDWSASSTQADTDRHYCVFPFSS